MSHSTLKRSHTSLGVNQAMWPAIWFTLLMVSVWGFPYADALLRAIEPSANEVVYRRASLASLLVQHLLVVSVAALLTTVCGVLAAIMVTRTWGETFAFSCSGRLAGSNFSTGGGAGARSACFRVWHASDHRCPGTLWHAADCAQHARGCKALIKRLKVLQLPWA